MRSDVKSTAFAQTPGLIRWSKEVEFIGVIVASWEQPTGFGRHSGGPEALFVEVR
jgi:hypothetical protein